MAMRLGRPSHKLFNGNSLFFKEIIFIRTTYQGQYSCWAHIELPNWQCDIIRKMALPILFSFYVTSEFLKMSLALIHAEKIFIGSDQGVNVNDKFCFANNKETLFCLVMWLVTFNQSALFQDSIVMLWYACIFSSCIACLGQV